jgi:hypothetical protein
MANYEIWHCFNPILWLEVQLEGGEAGYPVCLFLGDAPDVIRCFWSTDEKRHRLLEEYRGFVGRWDGCAWEEGRRASTREESKRGGKCMRGTRLGELCLESERPSNSYACVLVWGRDERVLLGGLKGLLTYRNRVTKQLVVHLCSEGVRDDLVRRQL